jgi:hypothetical protein
MCAIGKAVMMMGRQTCAAVLRGVFGKFGNAKQWRIICSDQLSQPNAGT